MDVIAHRGRDNHTYPDNTIPSLLESLQKEYIDGIELDVRMTKDYKLILSHNPILIDFTKFYLIPTTKYKKISSFSLDGIDIPTLEQVLSSIKINKKIFLDIKEGTGREKRMVKEIKKILAHYDHLQIYICSFNEKILEYFGTTAFPKAIIIMKWINGHELENEYSVNMIQDKLWNKISFTKSIYIWTVNTKEEYEKVFQKKSAYPLGIITDVAYKFIT